ncbi:hypothetical protein ANN_07225 [Periplaneta americana]|uniref:RNase H type-1 domain-containing protein n=1 Tax=Periplaneta americana TaxID=6978 RepID=A0ABQ8TFW1_PERAM|nr:hypothetical protein ANN_07225 [Periplaneta americana]
MTLFDGSLATSLFGKVRGLLFDVVGEKWVEWDFCQQKAEDLKDAFNEKEDSYISKILNKSVPTFPPVPPRRFHRKTEALRIETNTTHFMNGRRPLPYKYHPTVFRAEPYYVQFANFEIGVTYEKYITLKNVSKAVGRFNIVPLHRHSKFKISWNLLPGHTRMVAPGMSVRLKIQFCSESMDDEREQLIITVQEGKLLLITLTAFKQAPQLRDILRHHTMKELWNGEKFSPAPGFEPGFSALCADALSTKPHRIPISVSDREPKISELQHKEKHQLTKAQRVHCTTIDCGPALLSDQVHLQLTFYNNGSNARFWFISEEEWIKEQFEDFVWWKNSILLPPFDIFPRAFAVDKGDNIVIHVLFRPTSPGLHVEKLYVMCDNYSYQELEIIGDGFWFEDFYVIIQNLEKTFPIDIEDDENALHFLDLGGSLPTGKVKNTFSVFNNSSLEMLYCWKQREAEIKCTPPEIIFNIPGLSVMPNVGTLIPNSKETFTVFCSFQGLPTGRYRQILQLFIVDVPSSSVSEKYKSHKLDHRRCVATGRTVVDILVAEIEVWLEILPIIVTLDPNFISVTGSKLRCDGVTSKRLVTVSNKTASVLTCEWQLVPQFDKPVVYVSCILTMTPAVFRMPAHSSVTCVLNMLPHDPGRTEERFSSEKRASFAILAVCNLWMGLFIKQLYYQFFYGCEIWTLTLREEQRLRVFEIKMLRKMIGPKRDELTGEWRKLHNAELHALYSSPDIIRNIKSRRLRWTGHVARMGESRNAYIVLVGRPEGKRPLGRPRRRCLINGGAEVLELPVVVEVDEPVICPSVSLLDFGIVMRGNRRVMPLNITNKSTIEASWELQEFGYSTKNKELYPRDFINLCHPFGTLSQGNSCTHNYNLDATVIAELRNGRSGEEIIPILSKCYNKQSCPVSNRKDATALFIRSQELYFVIHLDTLNLTEEILKSEVNTEILKQLSLETINIRYPPQNWLHLYTDGSLISREQGAGAGVTCCLFSLYRSLGYGTTSFDGEIIAISESLRNLLCHINKFRNAVILSDSKAAILSIVSKHTPSSQTAEITKMLSQLISLNKRIVFQWIPSHCGILGNENADALAKKGSTATYRPVTKIYVLDCEKIY